MKPMPHFQRPRPIPRLAPDDAAFVAALLGGQIEPDIAAVERYARIMAAAYGLQEAREAPGRSAPDLN